MTGPDLFGVAVRTIGLLKLAASLWIACLWVVIGALGPAGQHWPLLFVAFGLFVAGVFFLRSADLVVLFAYPQSWLTPASARKSDAVSG